MFFGSSKTEEEKRNIKFHNLDMITSVDYYVKSKTAPNFVFGYRIRSETVLLSDFQFHEQEFCLKW